MTTSNDTTLAHSEVDAVSVDPDFATWLANAMAQAHTALDRLQACFHATAEALCDSDLALPSLKPPVDATIDSDPTEGSRATSPSSVDPSLDSESSTEQPSSSAIAS